MKIAAVIDLAGRFQRSLGFSESAEMAVTIHYRGKLDQLSRIEDLEDRILELALALGGTGRVWRSTPGGAPERMFRGIVLNLVPGQEATSLIVSPEGWLLGLHDLELAGLRGFSAPPWVQVKTGLGSMEGHVALIEMFRELKWQFLSDLEVQDETGYWDSGDGLRLARDWAAMAGRELQPGFRGLSGEAAEDPEIVASRLARLVAVVRQTLGQPALMLDPSGAPRLDLPRSPEERTAEQRWEQIERFRRRMQERLQRSIQERLVAGESIDQAIRGALESAGLPRPEELRLILPHELAGSSDDASALFDGGESDWQEEEREGEEREGEDQENAATFDAADGEANEELSHFDQDPDSEENQPGPRLEGRIFFSGPGGGIPWKRPLPEIVNRATDLSADGHLVMDQLRRLGLTAGLDNARDTLLQGLSDLSGGLIQAMINLPPDDAEDESAEDHNPFDSSWPEQEAEGELLREARIMARVQLRRAVRGTAFALGALAQFRDPPGLAQTPVANLTERLRQMNDELHAELERLQWADSSTDE